MSVVGHFFRKGLATDAVDVALLDGTKEVDASVGYKRLQVPAGGWEDRDGERRVTQRWGPYTGAVTFDRVAVYDGDVLMEIIPLEFGRMTLPGGVGFVNETILGVTGG